MFRKITSLVMAFSVALVFTSASRVASAPGADGEEKVPLDKVPKAIRDAVNNRFPDAKLNKVSKEKEDGNVVYDIELQHKGRKYEMDIKEDGTILEIEKEVAAKDLPEAVAKAIEARYPKAAIQEIMEVNKVKGAEEKPDHYEVLIVTANKKKLEIEVSLDGKTINLGKAEKDK